MGNLDNIKFVESLEVNGKMKEFSVSRLVAFHFVVTSIRMPLSEISRRPRTELS